MDTQATIRTQISLTPAIKKAIEVKKRLTGESLSGWLRKAALIRILAEEEEEKELEKLAQAVVGSVSLGIHSEWRTKRKLKTWIESLRKDW